MVPGRAQLRSLEHRRGGLDFDRKERASKVLPQALAAGWEGQGVTAS